MRRQLSIDRRFESPKAITLLVIVGAAVGVGCLAVSLDPSGPFMLALAIGAGMFAVAQMPGSELRIGGIVSWALVYMTLIACIFNQGEGADFLGGSTSWILLIVFGISATYLFFRLDFVKRERTKAIQHKVVLGRPEKFLVIRGEPRDLDPFLRTICVETEKTEGFPCWVTAEKNHLGVLQVVITRARP